MCYISYQDLSNVYISYTLCRQPYLHFNIMLLVHMHVITFLFYNLANSYLFADISSQSPAMSGHYDWAGGHEDKTVIAG
jgi:hypothetical protein